MTGEQGRSDLRLAAVGERETHHSQTYEATGKSLNLFPGQWIPPEAEPLRNEILRYDFFLTFLDLETINYNPMYQAAVLNNVKK